MASIKLIEPVPSGQSVNLLACNPADKMGLPEKKSTEMLTEECTRRIGELQNQLYADHSQALLVVFQGMDTAGKDGVIRRVFDHVNPAGISVRSFQAPGPVEINHDFLWRVHAAVPSMGHIGIFNRSHYEDVLVVRVHANRLLARQFQNVRHLWRTRYRMITDFEYQLRESGIRVIKFFLHISKEQQKQRLIERQKDPLKNWKLSADDFAERLFWNDYQAAYEKALEHTASDHAPWYIVPADHKWVRDYQVASTVEHVLKKMNPHPRTPTNPELVKKKFK